jgi:ADP-ribose pyrophosphatase
LTELVTKTRYAYTGRLLRLRVSQVRLTNGINTTREIVEHPGAVAIIPLLDENKILFVQQYRMAAGKKLLEIPAGTLERGETALFCAKRELTEETGYEARKIRKLFSCYLAPGYSTEKIHFFLGTRLTRREARQAEDETITVRAMKLSQGLRAIEAGRIQDAKTICGLYYLATHGKRKPSPSRSLGRSTG